MPHGTLRFKLPEERTEFEDAQRGGAVLAAASDFSEWLRRRYKHVDYPSPAVEQEYEEIRKAFYEYIGEHLP